MCVVLFRLNDICCLPCGMRHSRTLDLPPHSIMQSKELNPAEPELVICPDGVVFGRVNANFFLEAPYIPCGGGPGFLVHHEIESRATKGVPKRLQRGYFALGCTGVAPGYRRKVRFAGRCPERR